MPPGLEVTVPLPMPDLETVSVKTSRVNIGVTVRAVFMVTLQASALAESHPLQLSNLDPAAADAVSASAAPTLYEAMHASAEEGQSSPAMFGVTLPRPVPALVTVRTTVGGGGVPTVSVVLALAPLYVAVTVVEPLWAPVARPPASMVATVVLLLDHVAVSPATVAGV
jgi:hypothetical protein